MRRGTKSKPKKNQLKPTQATLGLVLRLNQEMLRGHQGLVMDHCKIKHWHKYTNTWFIARMSTRRRTLVVFMADQHFQLADDDFQLLFNCETQRSASITWLALSSLLCHRLSRMVTSPFISKCCMIYKPYIIWWWQWIRKILTKRQRHTDEGKYEVPPRPNVCYILEK